MTRPATIAHILAALNLENRRHGPASIRALAKRSGYSAATVKRALVDLVADGRARCVRGYNGHLAYEFVERCAMASVPVSKLSNEVRNGCVLVDLVSTEPTSTSTAPGAIDAAVVDAINAYLHEGDETGLHLVPDGEIDLVRQGRVAILGIRWRAAASVREGQA